MAGEAGNRSAACCTRSITVRAAVPLHWGPIGPHSGFWITLVSFRLGSPTHHTFVLAALGLPGDHHAVGDVPAHLNGRAGRQLAGRVAGLDARSDPTVAFQVDHVLAHRTEIDGLADAAGDGHRARSANGCPQSIDPESLRPHHD